MIDILRESPLLLNSMVAHFYEETNALWREGRHKELSDVSIVSVAGGIRDTLVRTDLSSLEGIVPAANALSVVSTSVPGVWVSTDHQCIVWCNQVVKVMSKCLFDLVDTQSKQATLTLEKRLSVLRKHFYRYVIV
jgi:glycosylphosphatidylinositol deacylase